MELPNIIGAIFQYIGVPIVVLTIFMFFYKAGSLLEENTSDQSHRDFAAYLMSGRLAERLIRLPMGTRRFFERLFGMRHLSLKCMASSVCFSLASVIVLSRLVALTHPGLARGLWRSADAFEHWDLGFIGLWLAWSLLPDYLSLLKTRFILSWLDAGRVRRFFMMTAIILADFCFSFLVYLVGLGFVDAGMQEVLSNPGFQFNFNGLIDPPHHG